MVPTIKLRKRFPVYDTDTPVGEVWRSKLFATSISFSQMTNYSCKPNKLRPQYKHHKKGQEDRCHPKTGNLER